MNQVQAGYLIARSFERMYRDFGRPAEPNQIVYSIPRRDVPPAACKKRYRGIARNPLGAWFPEGRSTLDQVPPEEPEAAVELRRLLDLGEADDDFIPSRANADRVWRMLAEPSDWDLIWAVDAESEIPAPANTQRLGFEPTWFTGDHFSAVADCMCFPVWHGTDEEGVLFAEHHERLNDHALFSTVSDAREFLQYYQSFDWTETGEYVIAEVRSVVPPPGVGSRGPVA